MEYRLNIIQFESGSIGYYKKKFGFFVVVCLGSVESRQIF